MDFDALDLEYAAETGCDPLGPPPGAYILTSADRARSATLRGLDAKIAARNETERRRRRKVAPFLRSKCPATRAKGWAMLAQMRADD